jgi:hypothetical protein
MVRWGSDGEREVVECRPEPVAAGDFGSDVVVAAAEVLDEGMPGGEGPHGAVALQSAQTNLRSSTIGQCNSAHESLLLGQKTWTTPGST